LPDDRFKRRLLAGALAGIAVFASAAFLDSWIIHLVFETRNDAALTTAATLGVLGSPILFLVPSALAFMLFYFERQNPVWAHRALFLLLASTIAPILVEVLKMAFGRPRPYMLVGHGISAFQPFTISADYASFPSEHAAVAAAMAACFSILLPSYRPTFFLLAAICAFSRVVLGVHYPSDALAGMLIGFVAVVALRAIFRRCNIDLHKFR
jgi:membrane-associated phospholipid phosphatase